MGSDLKPCPFCGAPAATSTFMTESLFSHNQVEFLNIGCPGDCDIFMSGEQQEELRGAWNRRAEEALCEDCPPLGYPTDKTRCTPCPRPPEPVAISQQLVAVLRKFVDFEDRYDADKSVSDEEVREATAFAKTLLDPAGPRLDWGGMHALVGQVARMNHESEQENGMSPDDAVDTLNSLITWARALVGAKEP